MILGNVHGYDSLKTNIQGMRNIGLKRLHSWPKTLNYWKWNTEEKYINSSFLLPENFLKPRVFPLAVQQGRCALFIFSMTQPHGWNPTWLHSERDAVKTPHFKWQIFLHSGVVCVCVYTEVSRWVTMWLPLHTACTRSVVAALPKSSRHSVSLFSHSAGLAAPTCEALLYRKHGDPPQVVK